METKVFGVRHHGPGSARSLMAALHAMRPDVVLIEGPPEAEPLLPLLSHEITKPPIALLLYAIEEPSLASFFPQAIFSPEWQAIQYAAKNNLPVRFIDLPQSIQFAATKESRQNKTEETENVDQHLDEELNSEIDKQTEGQAYNDPLTWLAKAAGFADGESWWEHMVELRSKPGDVFGAISEAMAALRTELPARECGEEFRREQQREAHMRQSIRAAQKEFNKIAVVCGAWHVPALETMPAAKEDAATLKGLAKVKVSATCIPWTHGRLAFRSGYRAGVESPGWYHHLWTAKNQPITRWLVKTARLFRKEDLDASSAHVIEAVRLAETLSSLRDRPFPSLTELNEATLSVLCHGNDYPLQLIRRKLIIGEQMGSVPDEAPRVPLQQNVASEQKRARLKADAAPQDLDLDLRNPTDLLRSLLLHRLGILGVDWGGQRMAQRVKGTFHELWQIAWQPEFEIRLIERASWGNTLLAAASAYTCHLADEATQLATLTGLLEQCLPADLPQAAEHVIERVQDLATVSTDVFELMAAVPPLANVVRYGSVRGTDTTIAAKIVRGLGTRICIGLPGACVSLNDDAAQIAVKAISEMHAAVGLLQMEDLTVDWHDALTRLADQSGLHGIVAGCCTRFLLQGGVFSTIEAARHLSLALSRAADPCLSAAWCEGFLRGSGTLLVNDEALFCIVDEWVCSLTDDHFQQQLPIVRRTFATFHAPEKRALGERVAGSNRPQAAAARAGYDRERAKRALPLLAQLLGLEFEIEGGAQ